MVCAAERLCAFDACVNGRQVILAFSSLLHDTAAQTCSVQQRRCKSVQCAPVERPEQHRCALGPRTDSVTGNGPPVSAQANSRCARQYNAAGKTVQHGSSTLQTGTRLH